MLFRRAAFTAVLSLLLSADAGAISIDYAALSDQSQAAIVQVAGGVTVTAEAFGGVGNPQNTMTPTGTPGGYSNINVNIGGAAIFGTRGLGCGPVASMCDLIAPIGEDVVRITFSDAVQIDAVTIAAMEDADDVSWWYWDGASYQHAGNDSCGLFSFCAGNETFTGPYGAPSTSWLFVAENSGATAFAIRSLDFTAFPVPEPSALLMVLPGLAGLFRLGRRQG